VTAFDIQMQMGLVFESLKTAEVQIQNNQIDLDKALKQEQGVKEGVTAAQNRLFELLKEEVISLEKVISARRDIGTIERFYDQSKARRMTFEAAKKRLIAFNGQLQGQYDALRNKLLIAEGNLIKLEAQCKM
jgi:hypothetical protein